MHSDETDATPPAAENDFIGTRVHRESAILAIGIATLSALGGGAATVANLG
jgi:hypothetical protein